MTYNMQINNFIMCKDGVVLYILWLNVTILYHRHHHHYNDGIISQHSRGALFFFSRISFPFSSHKRFWVSAPKMHTICSLIIIRIIILMQVTYGLLTQRTHECNIAIIIIRTSAHKIVISLHVIIIPAKPTWRSGRTWVKDQQDLRLTEVLLFLNHNGTERS